MADEEQRAQLIEAMGRYADGDAAAFQTVYTLLAPTVTRTQRRWFDEETARDLTQKTFLRVHRARDRYQRGAPVAPWVVTIARRLAIDELRRRGRSQEEVTRGEHFPEVAVAPAELPDRELTAAVREAVDALPDSMREVVRMHSLEDRPFAEVAAVLGIETGTARVRAHRGYQKLRETLAELAGRTFRPA